MTKEAAKMDRAWAGLRSASESRPAPFGGRHQTRYEKRSLRNWLPENGALVNFVETSPLQKKRRREKSRPR